MNSGRNIVFSKQKPKEFEISLALAGREDELSAYDVTFVIVKLDAEQVGCIRAVVNVGVVEPKADREFEVLLNTCPDFDPTVLASAIIEVE